MGQGYEEAGIAYCIPTYNHPQVMEDVLGKCLPLYQKYKIDVYVYDSSTDNKTCEITETFMEQGYQNLYYVRVNPSVGIDDKMLMIFSGHGLQKNYRYLWPVKDRAFFGERTLKKVTELAGEDYDAIFLTLALHPFLREEGFSTPKFFDSPAKLYVRWGWLATSMDATLFHVGKLLKDTDWEGFRERYFFDGENCFDHFSVLFHGLGQQEKCAVRLVTFDDIDSYVSPLGSSSWGPRIFHIWADMWPKVNEALPAVYDEYKNKVIRRGTSLPWILGSYDWLIKLMSEGLLNIDVYLQIGKEWESISDIPREELELIVCGQLAQVHRIVEGRVKDFIAAGRYQEASALYHCNRWIISNFRDDGENLGYADLLEIYDAEEAAGVRRGIFYGASCLADAEQKYLAVRQMVHGLEGSDGGDSGRKLAEFVRKDHVSSQCLCHVVDKTCMEKEKTMEKLLRVLQG